ncbi:MAG: hypothetical protein K6F52_03355 [Clostridia bacterium]|nr:hypothetical protein [Clostridia bacterium]
MEQLNFPAMFFRIYDKKILSGEITFSRIGISKAAFTALCRNEKISLTDEELFAILERMNLNKEEIDGLLEAYKKWKDD